ncbi:MAG: hypothetical protein Q8S92_08620 [Hydrogenophaga sp.]|uniref:hypothetical protein n=1 Tax=Hydrogenophaga sp. TaxID=1904254 RepID=UPI0027253459|nr:hypothetical protein [Hydrogenophaga sp.]MDO8889769.1 hypothetical protein [Hydrogenophaga sp.]MDP3349042.1 hypothetical protein [Hydrogenophaga sp.]
MKKALLLKTTLALALATPLLASAESQLVTTGNAVARLDFRVIIPRVLFLGVGTGATTVPVATNTNVDLVTFDYTTNPAAVGTGAVAGVINGNVVPVRVVGNNGQIVLTAATSGALSNGSGDTIPWSQISATTNVPELPSPVIPLTGTGAGSNVTLNGTKTTDRSANWTFSFANSAVVPAGTYGATVANNSRVTYTATMP